MPKPPLRDESHREEDEGQGGPGYEELLRSRVSACQSEERRTDPVGGANVADEHHGGLINHVGLGVVVDNPPEQ